MATNKYWNSDIYVIRTINKESGEVSLYVGSTTNFDKRKGSHKSNIYNETGKEYHRKLYTKIRSNSGDWNMDVYKHFRCENQNELEADEERVRVILDADLNMKVCSTGLNTDDGFQYAKGYAKAYNAENKEKMKEYQKVYYTKNAEKLLEYQKEYVAKNKEKRLEKHRIYNTNNREKMKEKQRIYYANNKEKILEKNKIYYAKNKDKIVEKKKG